MGATVSFHGNHLTQPLYDIPGVGTLIAMGTTVPSDAATGYSKGCLFIDTDGSAGAVLYVNEGDNSSADFNLALSNESLVLGDGVTAGTWAVSKFCSLDSSGDATLVDGTDFVLGTSTGTKIGTAVSQKLGLFNATPIVQPSGAAQAALGTATTVGANTGTAAAGLSLIGDTTMANQAAAIMNDFVALQEDIAALFTLVTAMRTALVNLGAIKGAA